MTETTKQEAFEKEFFENDSQKVLNIANEWMKRSEDFYEFRDKNEARDCYADGYTAGYKQGVKDEKKRISDGLRELEK